MFALTLNPGFVLALASLLALAAPRGVRPFVVGGAAILALWLLLDHEFGAAAAVAQMGLPVVLLDLDALNRIFGIALLMALVGVAIYGAARRSRYEDAAILMTAGGAVSALFVGDLVSFVAAVSVSGLGAAWLVFVSPEEGAGRAGARLLMWQGLEGLLLLVGVALHLSSGADSSMLERFHPQGLAGGFILAALLIRVAAPLAHVWLKDAIGHASPIGAAALTAFSSMLGVYALARFYAADPILLPVAMAMIVIGVFYAVAKDDLRRAGAYGLMAQSGVCVALIGVGSPLSLAAAEAHAFAAIFAFMALQMTLGALHFRLGGARVSEMTGKARQMPLTSILLFLAGLAVAAAPGAASYASHALALQAFAEWSLRGYWAVIAAAPGALFAGLALRPILALNKPGALVEPRIHEAPFPMLLGSALVVFFCFAVGLAPAWLFGLLPGELAFLPFAPDRLAHQLQVLGVAGMAYLLLAAFTREAQWGASLLDIDAFYSGPLANAGAWFGRVLLAIQVQTARASERVGAWTSRRIGAWMQGFDRPYAAQTPDRLWIAAAIALALTLGVAQFGG